MKSILDLQRALLSDDPNAVRDILDETNRRTSNQSMLAASEALGFKVGMLDGWFVSTGAEIAHLMGHKSESTVRKMRIKYGLMSFNGGVSCTEFTKLREIFALRDNGRPPVFCGWDTVLVCGARGRTPEADKILLYLIDCERALRVITDRDLLEHQKLARSDCKDLAKLIQQYRSSPDDPLTQLLGEKTESAFGVKIPPRSQLKLV